MTKIVLVVLALVLIAPSTVSAMDITVHRAPCPFYEDGGSCADPAAGEVWVEPGANRFTYWHEIAHVWEHRALTDEQRAWFTARLRMTGRPWYGTEEDYGSTIGAARGMAGEVFADAFAACRMRMAPGGKRKRNGALVGAWTTSYGYYPTTRQHRRICTAIAVLDMLARR